MENDTRSPLGNLSDFNTTRLHTLITIHEEWMLRRLTKYVIERGFGEYVPPLIESWRLALAGVSESILIGLADLHPHFELSPDDDYTQDPVSRFAVLEAHRHRERGITLNMFLGLLIYFRQIYLDLIRFAKFELAYERGCNQIIHRLFDRMLISIATQWTGYDKNRLVEDLQANNRLMTNEKNKYLSIFESHPHLVFILDKDNRIDNMNHQAAAFFHHDKLPGSQYYRVMKDGEMMIPVLRVSEEILETNVMEKISSETLLPWLACDLKAFSASNDLQRGFEKKVDGEHGDQYFNVKLSRTIDARNEIRGIILTIEDITSQKRFSEELRLAKEKAESANQAKSAFLANMSHELRTPLNAILGFTNLIMKAPVISAEQMNNLKIIANSGENLLNLINNVLDISKIEAGHIIREDADVDLHQLLNEIKALMSIRIREKGLTFHMMTAPDLPRMVTVDHGKLRQVLINLVSNAVKYTEKGEISLMARVVTWASVHRARLRFEVKDTGIGIGKADQDTIFTAFKQINAHFNAEAGTGLGLTICKQYTELMEGNIGVTSDPRMGSVFHVEIPVQVCPESEKNVIESYPANGCPPSGPIRKHFRILIAEDHKESRLLLHKLLEPFGFELREAINGQEAVEVFDQWRPHLIWMDIRMPVMNGLEATRRIKAKAAGKHTKIIALTAHALEEEREEILLAGCDDFIRKPFRDMEIFDALKTHLDGKCLQESIQDDALDRGQQPALGPHLIENLPRELNRALLEAAELLDANQCLDVAHRIDRIDPETGYLLRKMIEDFRFQDILTACDHALGKDFT